MNASKATNVKVHGGVMPGGIAKGEPCKVVDYSTDHGKTWINHGIYCRNAVDFIDRCRANLLAVGAISSRIDQVFPTDCEVGL